MFAFGFGGIFVITQMHGLGWPRWVRAPVLAAYVAGVLAVYGALGWERLAEVVRIPFIDYAAVFALAGLIGGALGLIRLVRPSRPEAAVRTRDVRRHRVFPSGCFRRLTDRAGYGAARRSSKSVSMRSRRNARKSSTWSMPPTAALHRKLPRAQFGSSQDGTSRGGGTTRHPSP